MDTRYCATWDDIAKVKSGKLAGLTADEHNEGLSETKNESSTFDSNRFEYPESE